MKMPNDHRRVRLNYISEARRDQLTTASSDAYTATPHPPLFEMPDEDVFATVEEADDAARSSSLGALFVAYYSSSPFGLGHMFLAPAQLRGNYLEFSDPEPLAYRRTGLTTTAEATTEVASKRFASGERPRTTITLRDV
ncbi:hypothetical protein ACFWZW_12550 [Microbacterium enclense]|uniref:hypothetical protein n=1 Tax=Microbacterium enclense TaxID=993073 RepID=UPI0036DE21FA